MLKLYSPRRAERYLTEYDGFIRSLAEKYAVPAACIKAVLFKEITDIDLLDIPADAAVRFYWLRYSLRRRLRPGRPPQQALPRFRVGPFGKSDSSTGWAQIFSRVAIRALAFAEARGLTRRSDLGFAWDGPMTADDPDLVRAMWRRLHRDRRFNVELGVLNLLAAAEERVGSLDLASFTPEELQRTFTRYNSASADISAYGKLTYGHYLRFRGDETQEE